MTTFRKTFIVITSFLCCIQSNAGQVTPFSSSDQKRRVFSLIDRAYEDTRVDHNEDKKIDYWKVHKGDLIIEGYYQKTKTYFRIRKFQDNIVKERLVLQEGNKLKLVSSSNRRQHLYAYTSSQISCLKQEHKSIHTMLEDLSKTTIDTNLCIDRAMDESCYDGVKNEEFTAFINQAIKNVYNIPSNSPTFINKSLSCIEGENIKSLFVKRFGDPNGSIEFEKAQIGIKNSLVRFMKMQEDGQRPIIYCKQTDQAEPSPSMVTGENNKIQIHVKKPGEKYSVKELEKKLFHENLHLSSITDEELTKAITASCYEDKLVPISQIDPNSQNVIGDQSGSYAFPTAAITGNANQNLAEKNAVAIPSSVEAPLPPPSNASPIDMNRVAAVESTERVQSISNSQSRGIVRMAESVLAATPAVAAPSTTGLASATSGSSSSRLPASTYKASTSAPAAKLLAKQNSNGLKPGEYIKEEIDLTQQSTPTRPRVAANAAEKPTVAASAKNSLSEPATTRISANSEIASSGSGASPAGRSNDTRLSISSSTGARSPRRGMASSGSAVSQVDFAKSKTGLVTQLSATSNYQKIRAQLDSTEFVQNLKDNSITVYNLQGKTWGAKKGDIIFLDQGDRFVREK